MVNQDCRSLIYAECILREKKIFLKFRINAHFVKNGRYICNHILLEIMTIKIEGAKQQTISRFWGLSVTWISWFCADLFSIQICAVQAWRNNSYHEWFCRAGFARSNWLIPWRDKVHGDPRGTWSCHSREEGDEFVTELGLINCCFLSRHDQSGHPKKYV